MSPCQVGAIQNSFETALYTRRWTCFMTLLVALLLFLFWLLSPMYTYHMAHSVNKKESSVRNMEQHNFQVYEERSMRMRTVCEQHINDIRFKRSPEDMDKFLRRSLWFDRWNNFVFCPIKSVSSRTWKHHMHSLFKKEMMRNKSYRDLLRLPEKMEAKQVLESMPSIVFVRHPLSRLVSTYYQKLHRENWYSENSRSMRGLRDEVMGHIYGFNFAQIHKGYPTPTQFVRYLVEKSVRGLDLDTHFAPQFSACPFCRLDFEVIGKLETFQQDVNYIVERLGLQKQFGDTGKHANPLHAEAVGKQSKVDIMNDFLDQVPPTLLNEFYQQYSLDFELFDYEKCYKNCNKPIT